MLDEIFPALQRLTESFRSLCDLNAKASRHSSSELPPTYEEATGFTQRRNGGLQMKAGIKLLIKDGMSPLVARAYWNQTQSPLVRLSDGLIVAIMEQLDLYDILRLRHVSRDFMRLFSQSHKFRKHHLTDAHDSHRRNLLARISELCNSCVDFRKNNGYATDRDVLEDVPFIYCAGCRMEHRAFYFSAEQRHESNDDERVCRGRQGAIPLCEHVSITWDTVQRLAGAKRDEQIVMQCNDAHCKSSPCKHIVEGTSGGCCDNDKPQFKFHKDKDQKVVFELSVTTHLPFQRPRASNPGHKVSSAAFQRSVEELVHNRLPTGSFYWLPTNAGNLRDISKCFDPNVCTCLDWGKSITPRRFNQQMAASKGTFEWKLCPNPIRPWRVRPDPGSSGFTGRNELQSGPQDRCAGFSHNFQETTSYGSWSWEFNKCPEDKDFLVFRQTVRSSATCQHDFGWSWFIKGWYRNVPRDDEMRGISWCSEPNCRMKYVAMVETLFYDGDDELLHHRPARS